MRKILQINKLYYPYIGGVEQVVRQLAEGLNGITDMKVLVCRDKGSTEVERINGVQVYRAGSFGVFFSMPVSFSFFRLFKKLSCDRDIIHIHMPFPLADVAVALLGFKGQVVLWWHSDIIRQKKLMILYKPFMKYLLRRAGSIIVATEGHIDGSVYLPKYRDKCVIIPYGVDSRYLRENEYKLVANEMVTILFVGRLVYYKGCDVLLKAFRGVSRARLRIVGDGPMAQIMRNNAMKWGIGERVCFILNASASQLEVEYANCDMLVLPSVENSEAFGLVQLEAMAFGKPVINTNLPTGVPYVSINGITGITVSPGDVGELTLAMQKLTDDADLRKVYGKAAFERVRQQFTQERMFDRVMEIYTKGEN